MNKHLFTPDRDPVTKVWTPPRSSSVNQRVLLGLLTEMMSQWEVLTGTKMTQRQLYHWMNQYGQQYGKPGAYHITCKQLNRSKSLLQAACVVWASPGGLTDLASIRQCSASPRWLGTTLSLFQATQLVRENLQAALAAYIFLLTEGPSASGWVQGLPEAWVAHFLSLLSFSIVSPPLRTSLLPHLFSNILCLNGLLSNVEGFNLGVNCYTTTPRSCLYTTSCRSHLRHCFL